MYRCLCPIYYHFTPPQPVAILRCQQKGQWPQKEGHRSRQGDPTQPPWVGPENSNFLFPTKKKMLLFLGFQHKIIGAGRRRELLGPSSAPSYPGTWAHPDLGLALWTPAPGCLCGMTTHKAGVVGPSP